MQINLVAQNITLGERQKKTIEEKIQKLQKYADRIGDESTEVKVEISHTKTKKADDSITCQITIFAPRAVIRSETRKADVDLAIDRAYGKLITQIERYKARLHRTDKRGKLMPASTLEEATQIQEEPVEEPFEVPTIVKRKRFSDSRPMTEEEAIERMELIGHNAFLFNNSETKRYSLVYRRDNGFYGIIEPKMPGDEE
ncbi:ribosome-associated translation inhibitor RaiA [Candidatus Peregrinibacteria bacterium]|nr:ribosome-associated translation inhibitor RaiA [Candidatus Peregrinibacteria bacterium]